jgi:hypothetical protein
VDVRAIRSDPVGVSLAQLALSQRPALAIGILASLVARARQPRTVHGAEYLQASNWISAATCYFSLRRGSSVGMHNASSQLLTNAA